MQDKVIVVVVATGGIGSAVTTKLASQGSKLVLAARDQIFGKICLQLRKNINCPELS